ncbi:MAG: DUF3644 domain-containing protein [Victivallaceae bacterium]|nr:DUF3644 domain-containing protein [Victivallaceae bacterium]
MSLRKGKTKDILSSSIDSALLAVEIYNKPRTTFRVEAYVTLMIIAWTKLFHAYFNKANGDTYYYKDNNGRFSRVDGERKAWELKTCIKEFTDLSEPIKANLNLFIKLRNKIEHRHVDKRELEILLFGECQALLNNYESSIIALFGEQYSINESLAFSLQFSTMRDLSQMKAGKKALSSEYKDIKSFIDKYRSTLADDIFNSQEFSIKLIQIPKISNTNRGDIAIEFVKWNELDDADKANYDKITTLIKDKIHYKETINPGKLKPGEIVDLVKDADLDFNHYNHKCFYSVFSIRPRDNNSDSPFDTNVKYCHYDSTHNDYVYQDQWADFIVNCLSENKTTLKEIKEKYDNNEYYNIYCFRLSS